MSDAIITYPSFPDGTTASGAQVIQDFNDVLAVLNGLVDDDNLSNAGITASSKIKAATITAALISAGAINAAAMLWDSASNGVRAWRTPGYAGASGSRMVRIEKTVTLAADTTEHTVSVDWSASDSIDGAVTFSAAPTIVGLCFLDTGAKIAGDADVALKYLIVTARSTTGCTVVYRFSGAPTAGDVVLMAVVMGAA
jgi:hypothetical protein